MVAVLVASATAGLLAWRPRPFTPPLIACLSTAILLIAGPLALPSLASAARDFAPTLAFLIAMLLAATLADAAQVFDWAGQQVARRARGQGRRLFLASYVCGALTTLIFSLDVTAVLLTPVLCRLAKRAGLSVVPYVVATAVVANVASMALPISNLTNLLVYDLLGIGFWPFVRYLALPNLVALALAYLVLARRYRTAIDQPFAPPAFVATQATLLRDARRCVAGLLLGLLAAGPLGVPYWVVAAAGALALALVLRQHGRLPTAPQLLAGSGWTLVPLVLGLYGVVAALRHEVPELPLPAEVDPLAMVAAALLTTAASNLFNNLPAALWLVEALRAAPEAARLPLAMAGLLGTNLGPLLAPTGSLATLLVLDWGRRIGAPVPGREMFLVGLCLVPLLLAGAGLMLLALLALG